MHLGISPFLKTFKYQSVVDACVVGMRYELLEYLVKDSKQGLVRKNDKPQKYKIVDFLNLDYYWKSRAGKDQNGNNTCHLAFEIAAEDGRYKYLKILMDEEIGDVNKRNKMGYLPQELEHA